MYEDLLDNIVKELREAVEAYKEVWANGTFTSETVDGTVQLNAKALGKVQMAQEILESISDAKKEWEGE